MFWDIERPVSIETNNIEFKMADKMADKVSKPMKWCAENGNSVLNNVYLYTVLPILIKA